MIIIFIIILIILLMLRNDIIFMDGIIINDVIGGSNQFEKLKSYISPELCVSKINNYILFDESKLLCGLKQRIFSFYLGTIQENEIVYAGTAYGYGQLALCIGCKLWNKN